MQAQGEAFQFNWSWCCNDQLTCAQTRGRHISTDGEKHGSEAYVKAFWRDAKWLRAICYSHSLSLQCKQTAWWESAMHRFCFLCTFQAQFPPTLQPRHPPTHSQTHTHMHRKGKEFCSNSIKIMFTHADSSLWYINPRSDFSRRES